MYFHVLSLDFCFSWFKTLSSLPKQLDNSKSQSCAWVHAYAEPQHPITPQTQTQLTVPPRSNKLQGVDFKETDVQPSTEFVSLHHWKCTVSSRGELGVMGLQLHNTQCQLRVSLLSCVWGVKRSRGQQRRGSSSTLTQVTRALLEIGQWPVWEGFATTCPAP